VPSLLQVRASQRREVLVVLSIPVCTVVKRSRQLEPIHKAAAALWVLLAQVLARHPRVRLWAIPSPGVMIKSESAHGRPRS
jgi:hypothetical protein